MNIFYLDENPELAAQYHCDKHVNKMIIESAQLLSSCHRYLDGELYYEKSKAGRNIKRWGLDDERESVLYKAAFINHPCSLWLRQSNMNYAWLYSLFGFLCDEYTYRYNRTHLTDKKLRVILASHPENIEYSEFTEPVQAMPGYCKDLDAVKAYRKYYLKEKNHLFKWTKRKEPPWVSGEK